ncbi:hypothetical protein J5N97_018993 [Dioscorea zingiberensis]|uniref:UMP-CMP kinase n=1 Tax=Dioscorea zingiberensis TaxID=325984 RepID=A0A9D5CDS5_9LILI|nr:hypothetical protein J5N97_018993 [Dioscorea zingiberensis]
MRWSSIFLSSLSRSFHRRLHPQSTLNGFEFAQHFFTTEILSSAKEGVLSKRMSPFIAFVLGGPGSGKGTQCTKIADAFGFTHLSAGDLLRKEILSNGENGAMILDTIKEGKIVPSEITVNLIRRAIETSENHKFLIDGFPRSDENRIAFERIVGAEPDIVLFFDCPEEEMVKRVLSRNQGRIDDNIETVKKRLKVFHTLNLPIVNYYSGKGKVHKINAVGTVDEIFEKVRPLFAAFSNNGKD